MNKNVVIIAICIITVAIILGAFGAHSLKELISTEKLNTFEVGVKYQMYHGLGLLIIGLNAVKLKFPIRSLSLLMLLGTILFSGSIYLLSIQELFDTSLKFLGPVTPIGGSILIISWIIFLIKIIRSKG